MVRFRVHFISTVTSFSFRFYVTWFSLFVMVLRGKFTWLFWSMFSSLVVQSSVEIRRALSGFRLHFLMMVFFFFTGNFHFHFGNGLVRILYFDFFLSLLFRVIEFGEVQLNYLPHCKSHYRFDCFLRNCCFNKKRKLNRYPHS